MGRGTSGAVAGAATPTARRAPSDATSSSSRAVRRGDDRAFEALYAALPAPHPRLRARHGQGPRPRRGHHAGGLRLRAAPHARDRAADRVQAVDLRDRQERLHRRSSGAPGAPRRSPTTPTTASRPPTTAASSAPSPTPDAAVAAKQELDHLCGAFGGLSETHHEILVLRELEGLSYREIGERMGMSRPAVESTLFRARRRLTEEYDELVSGARCLRIQAIIADRRRRRASARATRAASRATSPTASRAAARRWPPGSTSRRCPRTPVRRARRARRRLPAAARLPARAVLRGASRWCRSPSRWPPRWSQGRGRRRRAAGGRRRRGRRRRTAAASRRALKPDGAKPAAAHTRSASPRRHARPAPAGRGAAQARRS